MEQPFSNSNTTGRLLNQLDPKLELKIDFKRLETRCNQLKDNELKQKCSRFLEEIKEAVEAINMNLAEEGEEGESFRQLAQDQLHQLNTQVESFERDLQGMSLPLAQKQTVTAILATIKNACTALHKKLHDKVDEVPNEKNLILHEQRLLLEQHLVSTNPIAAELDKLLKLIKEHARTHYSKPNRIFISYAWAAPERMNREGWVQHFLTKLHADLNNLGIPAELDILDSHTGHNIYRYMNKVTDSDYVLLIGTESLLDKHQKGTTAVCTELNEILKKREKDRQKNLYRVLPLMLTGTYDTAFPSGFKMYTNMSDWRENSYLQNLRRLTAQLYQIADQDPFYKQAWQTFKQSLGQKNAILFEPGLPLESIEEYLKENAALTKRVEAARQKAATELLRQLEIAQLTPLNSFKLLKFPTPDELAQLQDLDLSNQQVIDYKQPLQNTFSSKAGEGKVSAILALSDNQFAVACGGAINLWDSETQQQFEALESTPTKKNVTALAIIADGYLAGSIGSQIKIWNLESKKCCAILTGHSENINDLAVFSNKHQHGGISLLASASDDGTIKFWRWLPEAPKDYQCVETLNHGQPLSAFTASPDGSYLVVGSIGDTKNLQIWEWDRAEKKYTVSMPEGHKDYVNNVILLPNMRLLSSSADDTVRLWDLRTKELIKTWEGQTQGVSALALLPSEKMVSVAHQKTIKLLNLENLAYSNSFTSNGGSIASLLALPHGLVSGSEQASIQFWNYGLRKLVFTDIESFLEKLSAMNCPQLQQVSLQNIAFTKNNMNTLRLIIKNTPITRLDLRNTGISKEDIDELVRFGANVAKKIVAIEQDDPTLTAESDDNSVRLHN